MKHATLPSITDKGAGFAYGGSVLDHRFGADEPYALGVWQIGKSGTSPIRVSCR
jgi:hypothetical protein